MTEERQIIESARQGNGQAFTLLMRSWYKRIFNFAYRYLNQYDEASDITQQTFIRAYQSIHTLKQADNFRAWIYIIASNLCRQHSRKASRHPQDSLSGFTAQEQESIGATEQHYNPEQSLFQQEWKELLQEAMTRIPEEQRIVIIMKEYEGLKFHEIATILGESENTVKSRMYYGLKALKKILTKWKIDREAIQYEV